MDLILLLIILALIFGVFGGAFATPWLFLLLVVVLILGVGHYGPYRRW